MATSTGNLSKVCVAALAVAIPFIGVRYPLVAAPKVSAPVSSTAGLLAVPDQCVDPSSSLPLCLQPQELPGNFVRTLSRQVGTGYLAKKAPSLADLARRYGMVTMYVNQYTSTAPKGIVFVAEGVMRFRSFLGADVLGRESVQPKAQLGLGGQYWHSLPAVRVGDQSWAFRLSTGREYGQYEFVTVGFVEGA